jgi:hypothetical protein
MHEPSFSKIYPFKKERFKYYFQGNFQDKKETIKALTTHGCFLRTHLFFKYLIICIKHVCDFFRSLIVLAMGVSARKNSTISANSKNRDIFFLNAYCLISIS